MTPKKQLNYKKISWPELYFLAESSREAFENVYLVTAKSVFVDKVSQIVYENLVEESSKTHRNNISYADFIQNVKIAIETNSYKRKIFVHEYVTFYPNSIEICINRDRIDDDFIGEAIDRLSVAIDKLNGTYGTVVESKQLIFSLKEIPWLYSH